MFKLVFKALNVRPEEENRAALLLGYGFFMGIFIASFQLATETQLVTQAGTDAESEGVIRQGLFFAAIFGVITTALFTFLQYKIPYNIFSILNLSAVLVIIVSFYVLNILVPEEHFKTLAFVQFIFLGPIIAVFLLGFWGVFGRLFDLRQSKRIIGGIDSGQLVAAIITFFVIGFGVEVTRTYNLLIASAVSVVGAIVFLSILVKKYHLGEVKSEIDEAGRVSVKDMLKNKYVVLLALFISSSIFAFLLVENSYLSALSKQYPVSEEASLRQFLGWFNGSILVLSLIFQTFFNDKIIAEYGLKIALSILPVVLGLLTVAVIVVGHLSGQPASVSILPVFFLFVALSKLFITFLREALENPTFKLYFMTLENKIRFDVQAKIEGVVVESAKVVAGGIIILLGLLSFFQIIHYYYILIFVIGIWIYIAFKLYAEYRNKIHDKLESEEMSVYEIDIVRDSIVLYIQKNLESKIPETVIFCFKLLEKINPNYVPPSINTLMKHKDENIRDFAQNSMNALRGVSVSDRYIISASDENEKKSRVMLTNQEINYLLKTGEISKRRLANLCRSEDNQDRQYGAELIGHMKSDDSLSFMMELLQDIDHNVRLATITTASKRHNNEVIYGLVLNLRSSVYSNVAKSALYAIGEPALPVLDNAFYKGGQDAQVMLRIVEIMGRIGGKTAIDMLWNKIDYPDKLISFQVLDSLSETGFKASLSRITRIKFAIESNISDISWNLAAYLEIPDNKNTQQLKTAIQEENDHDIRHIYTLLSMLYDAKSIHLIKQNLESGTNEGVTYAIELLDVLLAEDLKQKIIPILDDISVAERVRKLQVFYPRAKLTTQLCLKFLINRDFTQSNRWTKACAIYQIGRLKIKEFNYDLIANLFNPDMMVKEMAAWGLYNIDKEQYFENTSRLLPDEKQRLDELVLDHSLNIETGNLTFEKVRFLQSMEVFKEATGLLLSYVADDIQTKIINEGETISLLGEMESYFIIVRSGKLNYYDNGELIRTLESKDFIGERVDNQHVGMSGQLVALEESRLMLLYKDRYYELLSDNLSFAQSVIRYLSA